MPCAKCVVGENSSGNFKFVQPGKLGIVFVLKDSSPAIAKIPPDGLAARYQNDGLKPGLYLHWLQGRFGRKVMSPEIGLDDLVSLLKAAGRPLVLHFAGSPISTPIPADAQTGLSVKSTTRADLSLRMKSC